MNGDKRKRVKKWVEELSCSCIFWAPFAQLFLQNNWLTGAMCAVGFVSWLYVGWATWRGLEDEAAPRRAHEQAKVAAAERFLAATK